MSSKYLPIKTRTIGRGKNNDKTNMARCTQLLFWGSGDGTLRTGCPHAPLGGGGTSGHHLSVPRGSPPPAALPPTRLASLPSAGSPWTGTAPCPAGRLPRSTSAAPSASAAGCAPSPGPSACALPRVQLRKWGNMGQGLKRN